MNNIIINIDVKVKDLYLKSRIYFPQNMFYKPKKFGKYSIFALSQFNWKLTKEYFYDSRCEWDKKYTIENLQYKNSLEPYSRLFMFHSTNITQQLLKLRCRVHSTPCFSIELNLNSDVKFEKSFLIFCTEKKL